MKKYLLFLTLLSVLVGAVGYLFHAEIMVISFPARADYFFETVQTKTIPLYWFHNGQKVAEKTACIWKSHQQENCAAVIGCWVSALQQEHILPAPLKVEQVALSSTQELFISFSQSPCDHQPIMQKWQIIESLILTLHPLFPDIQGLRLLVKGKPLRDRDIDGTHTIALAPFLIPSQLPTHLPARVLTKVVIHPYGDKNSTGRVVLKEFERTYTRKLSQALYEQLIHENIQVFLTHETGHVCEQHECAMLANRLPADLYLHITCYETIHPVPEITCYYTRYNPSTDFWHKKKDQLSFMNLQAASRYHSLSSAEKAERIYKTLAQRAPQAHCIYEPRGFPLAPLEGINVPALIIECGIQKPEHIQDIAALLAQALV